jgi:hypothetical protein
MRKSLAEMVSKLHQRETKIAQYDFREIVNFRDFSCEFGESLRHSIVSSSIYEYLTTSSSQPRDCRSPILGNFTCNVPSMRNV